MEKIKKFDFGLDVFFMFVNSSKILNKKKIKRKEKKHFYDKLQYKSLCFFNFLNVIFFNYNQQIRKRRDKVLLRLKC